MTSPAAGVHLATFESPADARLGTCVFNTAGDLLAVPDLDSGGVVIWDLRAVRRHLASMRLDWTAPTFLEGGTTNELGEWQLPVTNFAYARRDE